MRNFFKVFGRKPIAEVLLCGKAKLPTKGMQSDAGYDIYSTERVVVPAGQTAGVKTHLHVSVPPGYYYTIEGRSSLYYKRIVPYRGIIDSTYTGELTIFLQNFSSSDYIVEENDRIAQLLFHEVVDVDFKKVDAFSPKYNKRGQRGYGSTGR